MCKLYCFQMDTQFQLIIPTHIKKSHMHMHTLTQQNALAHSDSLIKSHFIATVTGFLGLNGAPEKRVLTYKHSQTFSFWWSIFSFRHIQPYNVQIYNKYFNVVTSFWAPWLTVIFGNLFLCSFFQLCAYHWFRSVTNVVLSQNQKWHEKLQPKHKTKEEKKNK